MNAAVHSRPGKIWIFLPGRADCCRQSDRAPPKSPVHGKYLSAAMELACGGLIGGCDRGQKQQLARAGLCRMPYPASGYENIAAIMLVATVVAILLGRARGGPSGSISGKTFSRRCRSGSLPDIPIRLGLSSPSPPACKCPIEVTQKGYHMELNPKPSAREVKSAVEDSNSGESNAASWSSYFTGK
jgi:hypothetical protein